MKTLGLGAFSKVKLAVHVPTGQKVAIKIMSRHKMKDMEDKGIDQTSTPCTGLLITIVLIALDSHKLISLFENV